MSNEPNHPTKQDVVLGGQVEIPLSAVVLGGLEGVKTRLKSSSLDQKIAALKEANLQGLQGLNLIIQALQDPIEEVRQSAYGLLQQRPEPKAQQAIARFYVERHYKQLQRLLAEQQWQEADQETRAALCKACGIELREQLRKDQIAKLPCQDFRLIDQLWMRYSNGRFGFSIQKTIWQKCYKTLWDPAEIWSQFGDRVGWRVNNLFVQNHWKRYHELNFSHTAPIGHLPFLGDQFGIFTIEAFSERLNDCQSSSTSQAT